MFLSSLVELAYWFLRKVSEWKWLYVQATQKVIYGREKHRNRRNKSRI